MLSNEDHLNHHHPSTGRYGYEVFNPMIKEGTFEWDRVPEPDVEVLHEVIEEPVVKEYFVEFSDIELRMLAWAYGEVMRWMDQFTADLAFIMTELKSSLYGMKYEIMRDLNELLDERI